MARIPMTSGFTLCPEGVHVFRIFDVIYDENFGKLEVKMVNAQGIVHTERFSLKDNNDQPNEGALNAFSYFAKNALNDFEVEDIDHTDLIDHYIRAEVVHNQVESKKYPGKMLTCANLSGSKSPADGFDTAPVASALAAGKTPAGNKSANAPSESSTAPKQTAKPSNGGLDLDSLLG